ncbi:MAG TPA: MFS transporter [Glaciibacter sp.]|nr:MFS transporter [Glaciibacter sp.]
MSESRTRSTSGFSAYRSLLSDPVARSFSFAGFIARMPLSMTGLGVVILVTAYTGSFAFAGLLTAASTVAAAATAPWWGRMIDRIGQAKVLMIAGLLCNVSLALLILTLTFRLPVAVSFLAAIGTGLGFTSAGSCVRSRWSHRLSGGKLLQTAFAWEAVLDELIYVIGPVLVTTVSTAIHPAAGLASCVVFGSIGAAALALNRSSEPPVVGRVDGTRAAPRMSPRSLAPIVAACVCLGALFGGMELVVVANAKAFDVPAFAGVMLGLWAISSLIAGVVTGTVAWKVSPERRFRTSAYLLAVSVLPLPFLGTPGAVAACLLVGGLTVAPTLIASVAVVQSQIPADRLNEAFGWTTMGMAGGVALGAATLGLLVDLGGYRAGFGGVVAIGVLIVIAAACVRRPSIAP